MLKDLSVSNEVTRTDLIQKKKKWHEHTSHYLASLNDHLLNETHDFLWWSVLEIYEYNPSYRKTVAFTI